MTDHKSKMNCAKVEWALIMFVVVVVIQFQINTVSATPVSSSAGDKNVNGDSLQIASTMTPSAPPPTTGLPQVLSISDSVDKGRTRGPDKPSYVSADETQIVELDDHDSRNGTSKLITAKREQMPSTCEAFEIYADQPKFNNGKAQWNKCCPDGEYLTTKRTCEKLNSTLSFRPPFINATFFKDCIEDSEVINYTMPPVVYLLENKSLVYEEDQGDHLYILQNGSLLIVYATMLDGYEIHSEYCLDIDPLTQGLFALVYKAGTEQELKSGIYLSKFYKGIACIMIVSFFCLLVTAFFYVVVPRFGTLHGRSFALHSLNLAMGYIITSSLYMHWDGSSKMGGNIFIQYFVSAAFMWQLTMCIDTIINVWYYIPRKISPIEGKFRGWIHFAIYVIFSQSTPFLFTIHHGEDSADINYYMSKLGEENHDDQWYYYGPILAIIVMCIGMFVAIYYGFRKLNEIQSFAYIIRMTLRKQKKEEIALPYCSKEMQYVKDSARSTCFLFGIQAVCFISEVITFYMANESSIFFELINALQGVFILVIFIMLPKPQLVIRQWWSGDRGSLIVEQHRMPPQTKEEMPLNSPASQA